MIEANGLTKRLGGRIVVDDVSFRCEPGTVTGFLGPNGAGKTTTMRMLCGLSAPDAGRASVLGGA
jgi:ABC-2 type transport system ATP-binding protein